MLDDTELVYSRLVPLQAFLKVALKVPVDVDFLVELVESLPLRVDKVLELPDALVHVGECDPYLADRRVLRLKVGFLVLLDGVQKRFQRDT